MTRRGNIFEKGLIGTCLGLICMLPLSLTACNTSQTIAHGYQLNQDSLDLVPEGSSREQVLLSLGTPSTTQKLAGDETFYYISQTKRRPISFAKARVVDQRVLAIYFNQEDTVDRIANYTLKDGKVFDTVRRVTPTGGKDITFIGQILGAAGGGISPSSILGGGKKQ